MIRYVIYTVAYLFMLLIVAFFTPLIVLFNEPRLGGINNDDHKGIEPKLIPMLSWFDTPDNSLWGDDAHKIRHPKYNSWWAMTCWLYRNPLYGFKWGPLGAPVANANDIVLEPNGNYSMGSYFQYRKALTFGWILDAYYKRNNPEPKAIYVFWH